MLERKRANKVPKKGGITVSHGAKKHRKFKRVQILDGSGKV